MPDSTTPDYVCAVRRTGPYEFVATASSGAEVRMATRGTPGAFSPVELLLAALGGCSAFGVERFLTRRTGEPVRLDVALTADRETPAASRLARITMTYQVATADGEVPDAVLAPAVRFAETVSCTVSLALRDGVDVETSPPYDPPAER